MRWLEGAYTVLYVLSALFWPKSAWQRLFPD